jgi:hypothetical protein
MILPLPDFKPTFVALAKYRASVVTELPHGQALLLREASHRLSDIELLGRRIHLRAKGLLKTAAEEPVAGMGDPLRLLREAAATDAGLAKWFAENPDPRVSGSPRY